jgi:hypothetical protein
MLQLSDAGATMDLKHSIIIAITLMTIASAIVTESRHNHINACSAAAECRSSPLSESLQPTTPIERGKTSPPSFPILCVIRNAENGAPRAECNGKPGRPNLLQFALWSDGCVVVPQRWYEPGDNLEVGQVPANLVEEIVQRLRKARFFDDLYSPPGSVTPRIHIRGYDSIKDHGTYRSWDEDIAPGIAECMDPKDPYRQFVTLWMQTKIDVVHLAAACKNRQPISKVQDANGEFRGIQVAHPDRSPWVNNVTLWLR